MTLETQGIRVSLTEVDLIGGRIHALRGFIPKAFAEGKIDFIKLREALGDDVDDRTDRYSFFWAGKRDAIRLLQAPSG